MADDLSQVNLSALGALWFDESPDLMAIVGFDGNFKMLNRAWEPSLGYVVDTLIERPFVDLVHPEDQARTAAEAGRLAQQGGPTVEFENRFLAADGSARWLSWTVVPFPDSDLMLAVGRDISGRKTAESEMRASESHMRAILAAMVDGVVTIDVQGSIESFNPAAESIFGYRPDEVIGKNVKVLMPEPYHSEHDGYLANYLQTGNAKVIGNPREVAGRRKDGTEFPLGLAVNEVVVDGRKTFTGIVRDIGDRKREEDQLRQSEKWFRALVESCPIGIYVSGEERNITDANPAMERLLGVPLREILGKRLNAFWMPGNDQSRGSRERIAAQGVEGVDRYERVLRGATGAPVWAQITAAPLRDADGNIRSIVRMVEDVTEQTTQRKAQDAAEAALKDSESRLRTVLDTTVDAIITVNGNGTVESFNASAALMFGYSANEVTGKSVNTLVPEVFRDQSAEGIPQYLRTRGQAVRDVEGRKKNGQRFPIELAISRFEVDGQLRYTGVARDISRRVQAEKDTRLIYDTAFAAATTTSFNDGLQRCLELVCSYMGWPMGHAYAHSSPESEVLEPSHVWHVTDRRRFRAFRHASDTMAFLPGEGLPGRVWSQGRPVWIADVQADANFPRNRVASNIGVHGGFAFPIIVGTETVAVLEFFTDERAEEDAHVLEIMAVVGSQFGRLFERERARQQLAEAYEELKILDDMKDTFLSTVSHELRTPLTSIRGALGILNSGRIAFDSEDAINMVAIATRNSKRLADLINDVLDVQRISAGRFNISPSQISAADLLRSVVDSLGPMAAQSGIDLLLDESDAPVWADASRIDQVMVNLVGNAIKFSPNGSAVHLSSATKGDVVQVSVEDHGRGIPQRELGRIFERFQQIDASQNTQAGSGLGLWISKSIVELHGGRMWVESKLGQGSTFFFTLPTSPADSMEV